MLACPGNLKNVLANQSCEMSKEGGRGGTSGGEREERIAMRHEQVHVEECDGDDMFADDNNIIVT